MSLCRLEKYHKKKFSLKAYAKVHSVPSYKEQSYKERLVETFQSKEQILVEI